MLSWLDNAFNESGFSIQRSGNASFKKNLTTIKIGPNATVGANVTTVGPDVTTYVDTTVSPKTKYYYRVQAFNAVGSSAFTNTAKVATPGQLPATPTDLKVVSSTNKSITISWICDPANVKEIRIQRATAAVGATWTSIEKVSGKATSFKDEKKLKSGTTYWYRVQSYNKDGSSPFTDPVSGTTK